MHISIYVCLAELLRQASVWTSTDGRILLAAVETLWTISIAIRSLVHSSVS